MYMIQNRMNEVLPVTFKADICEEPHITEMKSVDKTEK